MRKRIIGQNRTAAGPESENWLNLETLAEVELTSEDAAFPIESALMLASGGQGWRAAEPGEQLIRLVFATPATLHRIRLEFAETHAERTQEFVLRWAPSDQTASFSEIVRQQWTFSPNGSTSEIEDYRVNLSDVGILELAIKPDISGKELRASLVTLLVA